MTLTEWLLVMDAAALVLYGLVLWCRIRTGH
jgi:hypothetical protein